MEPWKMPFLHSQYFHELFIVKFAFKVHLNVKLCPNLVLEFLILALRFLNIILKISPDFLSASTGQLTLEK